MQNLAAELKNRLPANLIVLIETAGALAGERGENLYLVGGAVRDLLLGKTGFDLDLVVEGDGISLAQALAERQAISLTRHPHFGTAKLRGEDWSLDITSARRESYAHPGVLPTVAPGSLQDDLYRRDYTVNAMALGLNSGHRGELIDYYGGQADLAARRLRVLHEQSFSDDATRIWRGLRYEQRLGFEFEENTRRLLLRDMARLETISGDRIRYELECIFRETQPEKVIARAGEMGALQQVHPKLSGNGWLAERYQSLRQQTNPKLPPMSHYLALLAYNLSADDVHQLVAFLKLAKPVDRVLRDTLTVKARLRKLAYPTLKPSHIYQLLQDVSPAAVTVAALATSSLLARQHLSNYLKHYRYVKPSLNGDDLVRLGVAPGPQVKAILEQLLAAKLDGKAATRAGQEMLARVLLESHHPPSG